MILLNIFLVILFLLLLREAIIFNRIQFYKNQNIKLVRYFPFFSNLIKFNKNRSKGKDVYEEQRTRYQNIPKGEHLYVSNNYVSPCCNIIPISSEAVQEFFKIETLYTKKSGAFKTFNFLGFFFKNGKVVEEGRATFGKIFHIENLKKIMIPIRRIVRTHVKKIEKYIKENQNFEEKNPAIFLKLKEDFFMPMFNDISNAVILGENNDKYIEKFEGFCVSEMVKVMFNNYNKFALNPLNQLSFGFAEKLNLLKEVRECKKYKKALKEILKKEYRRRVNLNGETDENNILDIAIKKNKQEENSKKMEIDDITDLMELFKLAASDTSFHGSSSMLTLLSLEKNEKYQKELVNEISAFFGNLKLKNKDDNYSFEDIDNLPYLAAVVKETMRLIPPAPASGSRKVIKDFKLKGYNIKKGDRIIIFFLGLAMNSGIFEEPNEFKVERFLGENKKKIPYYNNIPFSSGKRGCLGQTLGELMLKIIAVEFLRVFEFSTKKDYEMKLGLNPLYGVTNCVLGMKLR